MRWMDEEFFCEDHSPTNISDIDGTITDEVLDTCEIVFHGILEYCTTLLEIKCEMKIPVTESTEYEYCSLIYDDINESREIVNSGSYDGCVELIITKNSNSHEEEEEQEQYVILRKDTIACQEFAIQLLRWLTEFNYLSSANIRSILCNIAVSASNDSCSYLQRILIDQHQWLVAKRTCYDFTASIVIREDENRRKFVIAFTKSFHTNLVTSSCQFNMRKSYDDYIDLHHVLHTGDQLFKGKFNCSYRSMIDIYFQ